MRTRIALALVVLFVLLSSAYPAAAQYSPIPSHLPRESGAKPKSASKPLELSLVTRVVSVPRQAGSANDPIPPQGLKIWPLVLENRNDGIAVDMQRFGSGLDAPNCAHIRIFQAPEIDSEMVVQTSPGDGGPIQTFQGLPPCRRDLPAPLSLQRFNGVPPMFPFPPRKSLVLPPLRQVPSAQPMPVGPKSDDPSPKP